SVDGLRQHITKILGLDKPHRVGIVGAGNLGTALANYNGFMTSNFTVVAIFDNDKEKIGQPVGQDGLTVQDVRRIGRVVRDEEIDVAVVAVPARVAQEYSIWLCQLESRPYSISRRCVFTRASV
ncbi:MAG: Gfo/Idh/MocA family oxidoreductase, partial [Pyrinomonadaceae bacterium]